MTSREPAPPEADLIGKTVRIVEADWSKNVGIIGKATWRADGYDTDRDAGLGGVDHHWLVYPDLDSFQFTGHGYYGKRVELVEERPLSVIEAEAEVFKGKLCRITEAPWATHIGKTGYANWDPEGFPGRPDIRWVISRLPGLTTSGLWAKSVELVAEDATLIKEEKTVEDAVEGVPHTPFERRAWALRWAKETYPDGTDIDHMGVADWLLKEEERDEEGPITYPIYRPSEHKAPTETAEAPQRVEFTDSQGRDISVDSKDCTDRQDDVAFIGIEGTVGYLTALRAKRVIEVLQRAINRA